MNEYTALTGRPALPPAWSFGLWLSTSFTTNYDEAATTSCTTLFDDVTKTFCIVGREKRNIPLSVFHFDCFWMHEFHWCDFEWDKKCFPDIRATLKKYHDKGLHICAWINPYIAQGTAFFKEGAANGYLLQRADGRGVWQTDNWQAGMGLVDFTNPDAVKWYTDKLKTVLDCGVDCFKTDFGERIPVDVVYHDGSDPQAMHNYYTYLYNQAVFSLLKEVKGENEAVLFARSATAGSQKFPVHWGGDCSANYPSMAETLRGGLSFAMSGFSFWSHDISGFESTATPDLYKRWCAFGLMSTHSRLHGSTSYRVPWLFDEESGDVCRKFTKLKCRLMPYLYGKAVEAHEHGVPMMRPMMLEFPDDPASDMLDRQYMLGDSLLVAPIFRKDGEVQYYLPDGTWTSLLDGGKVEGGHWQTEIHDFMSLPLMVRPGTVLPLGAHDDRPDYDYLDGVELHVYQLADGESETVEIPDTKVYVAATFTVTMKDGQAQVETDSTKPYTVVVHQ